MKEDSEPAPWAKHGSVSSMYRVGDTIIFKFEGNIRATIEGSEIVDGLVWLECRALLDFKVLHSHVIGVESQEE